MSAYESLMDEWSTGADSEGCAPNEYFVTKACSILDGHGYDLDSFIPAYHWEQNAGNSYPCVDGFCFSEDNRGSLLLVICDFSSEETLQNMRQEELNKHFSRVRNFYTRAKKHKFDNTPPSDSVYPLLAVISDERRGFIEKNGELTFLLITNKKIPARLSIPANYEMESGCSVKHIVADFEAISSVKPPPLQLDFATLSDGKFKDGLPYLRINTGDHVDFYESYLLALPAEALVSCYDIYKTRLLEHNVRVYLQRKGKVNKGIQETITNEPQAFFIYNNGLAVTADSVDFSHDGSRVLCIHNPQVVNGGQTMASLHDAVKKDKRDISSISVQVKLTVVPKLVREVIVPYISRYSNSQNAVKDSDQRSNDIVQRALESHSRTTRVPNVSKPTYWYYERMKGQYENEQLHMTPAQKKAYQATKPKAKKIRPEEFSQAVMAYEMMPYLVVSGAQKCYNGYGNIKGFCDYVSLAYDTNPKMITGPDWYKEGIAKRILFNRARVLIRQQIKESPLYSSFTIYSLFAYVYTISLLVALLESRGISMKLDKIWEQQGDNQKLDDGIAEDLQTVANFVLHKMSQYPTFAMEFKNKSVWNEIKQEALENTKLANSINYGNAFYKIGKPTLISTIQPPPDEPQSHEEWLVCYAIPDGYWITLDNWLERQSQPSKPAGLLKRISNKKPTKKQCIELMQFIDKNKRLGIPLPPEQPKSPPPQKTVFSVTGNPVSTFLSDTEHDLLLLDRTCDLEGGSIFLGELFQKCLSLKVTEKMRASDKTPELGEIRVFDLTGRKKVAFAYTRLTADSVFYLPILEVCLGAIAKEFPRETHILMSHVRYESADSKNKLNRHRITETVKSELYMMEKVTVMSLPAEDKQ